MTDAMRERPAPYIQNHVSWCWATAAKIVGFHFLMSTGKSIKPEQGIIVESMVGFRWDYVRKSCEHIFADAWQYDIVKAARSPIFNPSGDKPEGDVGKERALKYVIAGDPDSETPVIRTLGKYDDKHSLYQIYGQSLFDLLDCSGCVIGNYQKLNGSYHSVVLSRTEKGLKLFDPWDGFADEFTVEQIFQSGFLSNSGPGIVKWIQYVAE